MIDHGWDDVAQTPEYHEDKDDDDEKPKQHKDRDTDVQPKKHKVLPSKPEPASMDPPAPRKDPDAEPTKTDRWGNVIATPEEIAEYERTYVDHRSVGREYDADGKEILTPEEQAAMRKHLGEKAQPPSAVPDPEPEQVDVPVAPLTDVLNGDSRTEHGGADGVVEHPVHADTGAKHIYQFRQPRHFEAPTLQHTVSKSAISAFENA